MDGAHAEALVRVQIARASRLSGRSRARAGRDIDAYLAAKVVATQTTGLLALLWTSARAIVPNLTRSVGVTETMRTCIPKSLLDPSEGRQFQKDPLGIIHGGAMNRTVTLTVGVLLATLLLGFTGFNRSQVSVAATSGSVAQAQSPPTAGWTLEGCWAQFPAGTCYDIYRDSSGNYWLCKACGTTKNPGPSKCRQISSAELARGSWCS